MRFDALLARANQMSEVDVEKFCPKVDLHPELRKIHSFGILTDLRVKQFYAVHAEIMNDLKKFEGRDRTKLTIQDFTEFARLRACRVTLQSIISHEIMQIYQDSQSEGLRKIQGVTMRLIRGWEVVLVQPVSAHLGGGFMILFADSRETLKPN